MALERVVVGIDGSGGGDDALAWAIDWSRRAGAEVVAVYAVGLLWNTRSGRPEPAIDHRDEIRERFEGEWLEPLDRSGLPARKVLRNGTAASVLLSVAAEEDADLVVVGKRGTGRFAAALLGSSALQVAQHAPCPVLIVPDGHPPERVTSIVVGTDGSPLARQALRCAIDLAGLIEAPLTVAYVVDEGFAALGAPAPEPAGGAAPGAPAADDEGALDAAILDELDRCCADVADAGIEVRRLVEVGDAAGRLVEISSAPGTVVVVGSRGSGGFDDLRLGSVSHRVIHHAASPVVVVRSSPPV